MRTCKQCGEKKKHSEFYESNKNQCKECVKFNVRQNYYRNREHYQRYERERRQRPDRRMKTTEYRRRHRQRHPDKYDARRAVTNALQRGDLVRQPCRDCGAEKVEAHHDDYTRPLDVIWLCREHHMAEHGKTVYV